MFSLIKNGLLQTKANVCFLQSYVDNLFENCVEMVLPIYKMFLKKQSNIIIYRYSCTSTLGDTKSNLFLMWFFFLQYVAAPILRFVYSHKSRQAMFNLSHMF